MEWKLTDSRPIWQQLTEQITLRILKGEYPPGGRLPAAVSYTHLTLPTILLV